MLRQGGLDHVGVISSSLPTTVRDMIKRIEADGWTEVHTVGSHRQFKHPTKKGRVTIAGRPNKDLDPFLVNSILRQAGLK